MTLSEIKQAIAEGKCVFWKSHLYQVIEDNLGQYLIVFTPTQQTIGLTWQDGVTLNGNESDFYIGE